MHNAALITIKLCAQSGANNSDINKGRKKHSLGDQGQRSDLNRGLWKDKRPQEDRAGCREEPRARAREGRATGLEKSGPFLLGDPG